MPEAARNGRPAAGPALPRPRGRCSEQLFERLLTPPQPIAPIESLDPDALASEDVHLTLYCCYELHYRGFAGVDPAWEWEPTLLALRARLEQRFERALRDAVAREEIEPGEVGARLFELAEADDGPSLSHWIQRNASIEQLREFLIHRSAYQLKEADPHTWAIPRLSGRPKAALVEVQADEYGSGRLERMHSELYAATMKAAGLDSTYGAYLDQIPAPALANVNLISMFGLHRRRRAALVGHLAMFEITSAVPNGRYAKAVRRLGLGPEATEFFDEHVEADSVHENIAAYDLAQALAEAEPALASDIVFGARCLMLLEGRWGRGLIEAWEQGRSSLRPATGALAAA
jgi:hypothetical protein